ncbi:MAG: hypothetical protein H7Y61_20600 [Rhizobiales bacterium]|nr:hypothetical protein [Rhizobacter sp.]
MAALTRATAHVETEARLLDLPEPKAMFSAADPAVALSNLMSWVGASNQRMSRLWRCLDQAADTDAAIRTDYTRLIERMRAETVRVVDELGKKGALRPGVPPSELADMLWLVALPDQHHRLCDQAGWSQQRYEAWLSWSARMALLPP